jgi:hypothetical protein
VFTRILRGFAIAALAVLVAAGLSTALNQAPAGAAAATARGTCVTAADLHQAALRGDTAVARLAVNYNTGLADFITEAPLCQTMYGTAAQNAYGYGARRPPGHGAALWPQQLAAHTPPQALSTAAGHHAFRIPAVRDECGQTDVSVADRPMSWPARQMAPGTPQPPTRAYVPGTPGERIGRNVGCFPPPGIATRVDCPTACAGRAVLRISATDRSPYAGFRVFPVINGRRAAPIMVLPGRTGSVSIPVRDGDRWALAGQFALISWSRLTRLTPDSVVLCPPYPTVQLAVNCLCGPGLTGAVTDTNHTRYGHIVTAVAGSRRWTVAVRPATAGRLAVAWPRGVPLVVTVQSTLAGHAVGQPVTVARALIQ